MPKTDTGTAPRRGRPGLTDEQKSEMRQQIADVAMRLFQTEGYAQVSIRRIATEIGCSPMTLYKYYDSKIDILRTLWADVLGAVFDRVDKEVANGATPMARLSAAATAYVTYWLEHTEHYRLVFMAEGVTQPEVSLFVDDPEIFARFEVFAAAITLAQKGEMTQDALKLKLDTLICFMNGIAHNLITISGYDWASAENMIEAAIETVAAVRD